MDAREEHGYRYTCLVATSWATALAIYEAYQIAAVDAVWSISCRAARLFFKNQTPNTHAATRAIPATMRMATSGNEESDEAVRVRWGRVEGREGKRQRNIHRMG